MAENALLRGWASISDAFDPAACRHGHHNAQGPHFALAVLPVANAASKVRFGAVIAALPAFQLVSAACLICDPNIIAVGARFDEIDAERSAIGEVSFSTIGRARAMGQGRGVLRLYADRASGRVLGSEMIAPSGEHLGHLLACAIEQRMTAGEILRMPFYHPVIEGALKAELSALFAKVDANNPGPVTEVAPAANSRSRAQVPRPLPAVVVIVVVVVIVIERQEAGDPRSSLRRQRFRQRQRFGDGLAISFLSETQRNRRC